ncbi:unnamed protein product [Cyprideis torosa]|uniref:Uncharacterized protein n=1 Tax=Cyprideis torosa TaxID=163714 RepID=A0A7R8WJZ5_9CRUS|nr:unnamed protein product [Cyprideis torosa]CAG0902568.1 unnamed protein product [Cyprideis torosa]
MMSARNTSSDIATFERVQESGLQFSKKGEAVMMNPQNSPSTSVLKPPNSLLNTWQKDRIEDPEITKVQSERKLSIRWRTATSNSTPTISKAPHQKRQRVQHILKRVPKHDLLNKAKRCVAGMDKRSSCPKKAPGKGMMDPRSQHRTYDTMKHRIEGGGAQQNLHPKIPKNLGPMEMGDRATSPRNITNRRMALCPKCQVGRMKLLYLRRAGCEDEPNESGFWACPTCGFRSKCKRLGQKFKKLNQPDCEHENEGRPDFGNYAKRTLKRMLHAFASPRPKKKKSRDSCECTTSSRSRSYSLPRQPLFDSPGKPGAGTTLCHVPNECRPAISNLIRATPSRPVETWKYRAPKDKNRMRMEQCLPINKVRVDNKDAGDANATGMHCRVTRKVMQEILCELEKRNALCQEVGTPVKEFSTADEQEMKFQEGKIMTRPGPRVKVIYEPTEVISGLRWKKQKSAAKMKEKHKKQESVDEKTKAKEKKQTKDHKKKAKEDEVPKIKADTAPNKKKQPKGKKANQKKKGAAKKNPDSYSDDSVSITKVQYKQKKIKDSWELAKQRKAMPGLQQGQDDLPESSAENVEAGNQVGPSPLQNVWTSATDTTTGPQQTVSVDCKDPNKDHEDPSKQPKTPGNDPKGPPTTPVDKTATQKFPENGKTFGKDQAAMFQLRQFFQKMNMEIDDDCLQRILHKQKLTQKQTEANQKKMGSESASPWYKYKDSSSAPEESPDAPPSKTSALQHEFAQLDLVEQRKTTITKDNAKIQAEAVTETKKTAPIQTKWDRMLQVLGMNQNFMPLAGTFKGQEQRQGGGISSTTMKPRRPHLQNDGDGESWSEDSEDPLQNIDSAVIRAYIRKKRREAEELEGKQGRNLLQLQRAGETEQDDPPPKRGKKKVQIIDNQDEPRRKDASAIRRKLMERVQTKMVFDPPPVEDSEVPKSKAKSVRHGKRRRSSGNSGNAQSKRGGGHNENYKTFIGFFAPDEPTTILKEETVKGEVIIKNGKGKFGSEPEKTEKQLKDRDKKSKKKKKDKTKDKGKSKDDHKKSKDHAKSKRKSKKKSKEYNTSPDNCDGETRQVIPILKPQKASILHTSSSETPAMYGIQTPVVLASQASSTAVDSLQSTSSSGSLPRDRPRPIITASDRIERIQPSPTPGEAFPLIRLPGCTPGYIPDSIVEKASADYKDFQRVWKICSELSAGEMCTPFENARSNNLVRTLEGLCKNSAAKTSVCAGRPPQLLPTISTPLSANTQPTLITGQKLCTETGDRCCQILCDEATPPQFGRSQHMESTLPWNTGVLSRSTQVLPQEAQDENLYYKVLPNDPLPPPHSHQEENLYCKVLQGDPCLEPQLRPSTPQRLTLNVPSHVMEEVVKLIGQSRCPTASRPETQEMASGTDKVDDNTAESQETVPFICDEETSTLRTKHGDPLPVNEIYEQKNWKLKLVVDSNGEHLETAGVPLKSGSDRPPAMNTSHFGTNNRKNHFGQPKTVEAMAGEDMVLLNKETMTSGVMVRDDAATAVADTQASPQEKNKDPDTSAHRKQVNCNVHNPTPSRTEEGTLHLLHQLLNSLGKSAFRHITSRGRSTSREQRTDECTKEEPIEKTHVPFMHGDGNRFRTGGNISTKMIGSSEQIQVTAPKATALLPQLINGEIPPASILMSPVAIGQDVMYTAIPILKNSACVINNDGLPNPEDAAKQIQDAEKEKNSIQETARILRGFGFNKCDSSGDRSLPIIDEIGESKCTVGDSKSVTIAAMQLRENTKPQPNHQIRKATLLAKVQKGFFAVMSKVPVKQDVWSHLRLLLIKRHLLRYVYNLPSADTP